MKKIIFILALLVSFNSHAYFCLPSSESDTKFTARLVAKAKFNGNHFGTFVFVFDEIKMIKGKKLDFAFIEFSNFGGLTGHAPKPPDKAGERYIIKIFSKGKYHDGSMHGPFYLGPCDTFEIVTDTNYNFETNSELRPSKVLLFGFLPLCLLFVFIYRFGSRKAKQSPK